MPLPIQNARISNLIHEAYNIVGRYRARIDETVVPVCLVDDFSGGGGFPIVRTATATFTQIAVAAERPVARFEVPNNVLGVITHITADTAAQGDIEVSFGANFALVPGNFAVKQYVDGRLRASGEEPAGNLTFDTQVATMVNPSWQFAVDALTGNQVHVQWPIGNATAFDFVEFAWTGVNQQMRFAITWTEYLIRP